MEEEIKRLKEASAEAQMSKIKSMMNAESPLRKTVKKSRSNIADFSVMEQQFVSKL